MGLKTKQYFWGSVFLMGVVVNLSEQTHLSEVVVSLLQSGELSQETLVFSPLFIQLCSQRCTRLRHSPIHPFCTHREEMERREIKGGRNTQKGRQNNTDCIMPVNLPSCFSSCLSKRSERSSFSLKKSPFSLCKVCSSLKMRKNSN